MIKKYLSEVAKIAKGVSYEDIEGLAYHISLAHRLFVLGVGGSSANASHAVADFRNLCGIEAHCFENLAELTARTNDEGWENSYVGWLRTNHVGSGDIVFVLSVGGGDPKVSGCLIKALDYAKENGCTILGIVGRDGGYTKKVADVCLVIPTVNETRVTPHTEEFQSVILHLITWILKTKEGKWESVSSQGAGTSSIQGTSER